MWAVIYFRVPTTTTGSLTTAFPPPRQSQNKDEDVFHFIGYVPIDGRLYELDGLKEGPIDLGACGEGQAWLDAVRPIIEKRIKKYSEGEIHFNLMALVSDRQQIYQRQIEALHRDGDDVDMQSDSVSAEVARLRQLIDDEVAKTKRYQIENIRRKHNYLPLIVELLKMLGEQGQLLPIYEKAKQRATEREAAAAKKN